MINIEQDKHWLVRWGPSPLPQSVLTELDFIYRRRWETLLAVDELVAKVYATLKTKDLLTDTYIIFTSDNGYHVGKYNQRLNKILMSVIYLIFGIDIVFFF